MTQMYQMRAESLAGQYRGGFSTTQEAADYMNRLSARGIRIRRPHLVGHQYRGQQGQQGQGGFMLSGHRDEGVFRNEWTESWEARPDNPDSQRLSEAFRNVLSENARMSFEACHSGEGNFLNDLQRDMQRSDVQLTGPRGYHHMRYTEGDNGEITWETYVLPELPQGEISLEQLESLQMPDEDAIRVVEPVVDLNNPVSGI
jgi:hypothetical protein